MSFIIEPHESAEEILSNWNTYLSEVKKSAHIFSRGIRVMPQIIKLLREDALEHSTAISLFEALTLKLKRAPNISSLWNATYARLCYEFKIESPLLNIVLSQISSFYPRVDNKPPHFYNLDSGNFKLWRQFALHVFNGYDSSNGHGTKNMEVYGIRHFILPLFDNITELIEDIKPSPLFFTGYLQPQISSETQLRAAYNMQAIRPWLNANIMDLSPLLLDTVKVLEWAHKYANDAERVDMLIIAMHYTQKMPDYMKSAHRNVLSPEDLYNCLENKQLAQKIKICIEVLGITDYSKVKDFINVPDTLDNITELPVIEF